MINLSYYFWVWCSDYYLILSSFILSCFILLSYHTYLILLFRSIMNKNTLAKITWNHFGSVPNEGDGMLDCVDKFACAIPLKFSEFNINSTVYITDNLKTIWQDILVFWLKNSNAFCQEHILKPRIIADIRKVIRQGKSGVISWHQISYYITHQFPKAH